MGCVMGKCCHRCQPSSPAGGGDPIHCLHHHCPLLCRSLPGCAAVPSHHLLLQFSSLSQRGRYPDSPDRENQDALCIKTQLQGNPNLHLFAVFDGHGQFGAQCAAFARDRLVEHLSGDAHLLDDPFKSFNSAFLATNSELHDSEIDDSMSGTTAIAVLVGGDSLFVANVGDSRAIAGIWNGDRVVAQDLSRDQTPFRKDEYERVRQCGARVLSVDQVEGIKDPNIQSWGDEESDDGDPPRLWVQHGMYPGTAFTRSVGDSTAENIGVIAVPEVMVVKITPNHLFFVVVTMLQSSMGSKRSKACRRVSRVASQSRPWMKILRWETSLSLFPCHGSKRRNAHCFLHQDQLQQASEASEDSDGGPLEGHVRSLP